HQTAFKTVKLNSIHIGFNKILTNLGTEFLKNKAEMSHDGIIFQNGMLVLQYIIQTQQTQQNAQDPQGIHQRLRHKIIDITRRITDMKCSKNHCNHNAGKPDRMAGKESIEQLVTY